MRNQEYETMRHEHISIYSDSEFQFVNQNREFQFANLFLPAREGLVINTTIKHITHQLC